MSTSQSPIVRHPTRIPNRLAFAGIHLVVVMAMSLPASAANPEPPATTDQQLHAKALEAWQHAWDGFFDPRTNLFYDLVSGRDPKNPRACLPTPEEIARQSPNRNGWGTGMEDCAISGGLMLSMICDRYAATNDPALKPLAEKVFAGLVLLGTLSPSQGFVIRGVCPTDARSHYCESSRDQYTWYVYGLWRYSKSPLSGSEHQATIRKIITSICTRLETNVVPANDYHIGREDGTFDGLVDKMWQVQAHEVARLPMIYAIAADLTSERHWQELAIKFRADAAAQAQGDSTKIPYAMLQHQVSLEAMYQLETSPQFKQQWQKAMQVTAGRAAKFLAYAREYQPQDAPKLDLDWRNWPTRSSLGYTVPAAPEALRKEDRTVRQPAEAALTLLLCPTTKFTPEQLALLKQSIAQVDYSKSIAYGLYYTQAAYWRAIRAGVLVLPATASKP